MFVVSISIFYLGSYFMGPFPQKSLTTNQFSRLLLYLMCTQTNRICSKRRPHNRSLIPGSRDSPNFECLPLVTSPLFVLLARVCIFSLHNLSLRARPQNGRRHTRKLQFENCTKWLKGPEIGHWDADEDGAAFGEEIASHRSPGQALRKNLIIKWIL